MHRVPITSKGQRVDRYIAEAFPELTRSRLQKLLTQGHVRVDGLQVKAALRLKGGEAITLEIPPPVPALPQPEDLPLTLLYQDRDLLVLDKASGQVVHPGAGHADGTLVNALLHAVKDLAGVGGELRPGIVHRLDKDTTGCLVVAKNDLALERLQAAFQRRDVDKRYLALVHGHPPAEGTLETFYGRHPKHRQRFTGKATSGKRAHTQYWTRELLTDAALVEVALHTGRTHQIRVHLSELGHPLLADTLYGGNKKGTPQVRAVQTTLGRQALHAWKLSFAHPRTGKPLSFTAPIPADFETALTALRPEPAASVANRPRGPKTDDAVSSRKARKAHARR